jgi:hypothetical protein
VLNHRIAEHPITIQNPNGERMHSTHIGELDLPMLRIDAQKAHIVPALQNCSLLSMGTLCKVPFNRRVIPPNVLGANSTYQTIGSPGENMSSYHCGRNPRQKVKSAKLNQAYTNSLHWDRAVNRLRGGTLGAMWAKLEQHTDQEEGTIKWMHPALFLVKANSGDNPTWNKAMVGGPTKGYWQACKKEYDTLVSLQVWEVVNRGLIFNPDKGKEVNNDCYVDDADFAGMWGYGDKQDPSCVKSRT